MNKIIFLDRDGTVIEDCGYLDNVEGVELLPGVAEGLKSAVERGFKLVLITNQSGIGRGMFDADMVEQQHAKLCKLLEPYGVRFAAIKICPHQPEDECECRKPEAGMILEAGEELDCDFSKSWMLGDKATDMVAGRTAGCRTVLFKDELMDDADYHAENMEEAVRIIKILDH